MKLFPPSFNDPDEKSFIKSCTRDENIPVSAYAEEGLPLDDIAYC